MLSYIECVLIYRMCSPIQNVFSDRRAWHMLKKTKGELVRSTRGKKVKGGDSRLALTFHVSACLIRSHPVLKGCFAL